MRIVRAIPISFIVVGAITGRALASGRGLGDTLDSLIQAAATKGDAKAQRRLSNLKTALHRLNPSDLAGISCGSDREPVAHLEESREIASNLLTAGLEKYAPALAAALASAPAAGIAVFLSPSEIAPDAIETLNNSSRHAQQEVTTAARTLLQDTTPERFARLPTTQMAKIVACIL